MGFDYWEHLYIKFKCWYKFIWYIFHAFRFSKRGFEWVSFFFVKYNAYCMLLLQINSFQFRCIRTRPSKICIIQIGMNTQDIHSFKRIFIEKLAYAIEWTNIFCYLFFNGSYMINSRYMFVQHYSQKFYWRCSFYIISANHSSRKFYWFLWNSVNLAFFMLIDNLLASNHWLIFSNSELIV